MWFRGLPMRAFASVYLMVAGLALAILFVLQVPGLLAFFLAITMGLGIFLVPPVLFLSFWIVAFAPAALGAWFNWRIGAGIAAVTLALAVSFPSWVPDPTHQGTPLLNPPFSATGPVQVRSIEVVSPRSTHEVQGIVGPAVEALKRNTDLEWLRIDGKVYERRQGVLHEARPNQENVARVADVIVRVAHSRHAAVWGNWSLSPWRVENVSGYVIHDLRTNTPLARNLSLKLERAIRPLMLQIDGVRMDTTTDVKIEFVRAPYGEVAQDPEQTLENDLGTLGLWRDAANTGLEPDNPTDSPAKSVDAVLEEMLKDPELAQHKGHRSRGPDDFEGQVIETFNTQLGSRLEIADRIDLIARLERSKIRRLDRTLIIEIAEETPALMQRMVDQYYTDLAEDASVYPILDRGVRDEFYVPLARAIGADRRRFVLALDAAERDQREFLIENIFHFGVEDPFTILRALFSPSPPGDPLEERFAEGYQYIWKEEWRKAEILDYVQGGGEVDKSAMQEAADQSLRLLLPREDVPRDVLIGFVEDWVLTRRAPILHDYEVLLEVLSRLQEIGAQELHANLLVYFADLIAFRPHWMDPPT
ncbi:hypothetical protein [Tropicibacter oceani]|uniref:Uncharacterized protein n=1 Tax=Tropicibacter oceani TaxID=3058420 RepID=A0ABY8QLU2_9RHOB|nr:hypothetical protein [Tropicibacter oceani]WGW05606.1 hypothetical protein QF118_08690 [Tropicibacter oceani]